MQKLKDLWINSEAYFIYTQKIPQKSVINRDVDDFYVCIRDIKKSNQWRSNNLNEKQKRVLGFWCMSPGVAFKGI